MPIHNVIMCMKARVSTIDIINPTVGNIKNLTAQSVAKSLQKRKISTSTWNFIVTSRRSAQPVGKDSGGGAVSNIPLQHLQNPDQPVPNISV